MTKPIASVAVVDGRKRITLCEHGRKKIDGAVEVLRLLRELGADVNEHFAGYLESIKEKHSRPVKIAGRGHGTDKALPRGDRT